MSQPSPARIERAMSMAMQLRAVLEETGDVDNQLLVDTLEGESDVTEIIDRLVETSVADQRLADGAKERARRLENRAEKARDMVQRMLEELGLERLDRPLYTASFGAGPQTVIIEDPLLVPDAYNRTVADKTMIKKVLERGEVVPGATLTNSKPVLRILTR